ncbi:MAG: transketolase [Planctomycetes bacterium TMED75]|nr:transketolase [Planctomycetaceae bacterium]OUU93608.1 MAG: transketolase [Planctomycetes bacterium TMED75]
MSFAAAVHAKAIQLDRASLETTAAAGAGHPTSAMSLGHIVTVLMYHSMRWVPSHPRYPSSDRLVLSEGHAVPIIYSACADLGVGIGKEGELRPMTMEDAMTLRDIDSPIDGHPNPMEGFPFFDAATGSLGMGLSVAAGLGLAARHDEINKQVYCIIGDGESREGQVWEAVDFIIDHQLTSVVPIFNCNSFGQADKVSQQQSSGVIAKKLEAAGFIAEVIDGHDPDAILTAVEVAKENHAKGSQGSPVAIVANTIKGWGSPVCQGGGWHGKPVTGEKLQAALAELEGLRNELTSTLGSGDELTIYPPEERAPLAAQISDAPSFTEAMKQFDMASTLATGKFATRRAFGVALRALGHVNSSVVVLDADVKNSTFTDWFASDRALSDRMFECKIAEQNMVSVAAGLSAGEKIPFAATFSKFFTRAYDQIELAINSGANIKIVGSHSGIGPASDGPSQMSLPDVSWFRSFTTITDHRGNPGCYVLQPADAYAAYGLTQVMADYQGVCYMRTCRPDVEFLYDDATVFNLGGLEVLTEGRDLLIVSAGYMLHECNKAIELLDKAGIDASLIDLYSLPFDVDALLDIANENGGMILTVEDNYGGGIGSAVADAVTESGDGFTIEQMHVRSIPKSARTVEDELTYLGLRSVDVARRAARMLGVATV